MKRDISREAGGSSPAVAPATTVAPLARHNAPLTLHRRATLRTTTRRKGGRNTIERVVRARSAGREISVEAAHRESVGIEP